MANSPIKSPLSDSDRVITGNSALGSACMTITQRLFRPFARAVRT